MNVDLKIAQSIDIQNILGYTCSEEKMDIELKDFFSDDDDDIMTIATQSSLFNEKMKELHVPTDTSSSRFGPTITVVELAKQRFDLRESPPPKKTGAVVV